MLEVDHFLFYVCTDIHITHRGERQIQTHLTHPKLPGRVCLKKHSKYLQILSEITFAINFCWSRNNLFECNLAASLELPNYNCVMLKSNNIPKGVSWVLGRVAR